MKISFPTLVGRFIALVLLANGLTVRAAAHDLPVDRCLAHSVTSNCMATTSLVSVHWNHECTAEALPASQASTSPAWWLSKWVNAQAASVDWPGLRNSIAERLSSLSVVEPTKLVALSIARPDQGQAPRPRTIEAKPVNQLSDGYLPYDLHRSDWAFKDLTYFGKSATAPMFTTGPVCAASGTPVALSDAPRKELPAYSVPEEFASAAGSATAECIALGNTLQRLELWQSKAHSWLSDTGALASFTESLTKRFVRTTATTTTALTTSPEPQYTGGPQYIVIETSVGGHIVLTLAQAAHWQFQSTQTRSSLPEWLATAFRPVQQRALSVASQQLESVGYQLVHLARRLSGSSEPQLASRPAANVK